MKIKELDGLQFEKMLQNGLANLRASEAEVNSLNVFPVPDGDTATNMCHTLGNALAFARPVPSMGGYLKQLSEGMLLGARGNSGVILSQIFRGFFKELARCGSANTDDIKNALICGYRTAYKAVEKPVEGTILTVAREGIEHIIPHIDDLTTIDALLSMYVAQMRTCLVHTTEMLPALKDAGVVDSGALGYILIVEGMVKQLYGETIEYPGDLKEAAGGLPAGSVRASGIRPKKEGEKGSKKPLSILCVCNAEGMGRLFTELGCDYIIDKAPGVSLSDKDFMDIFKMTDAGHIAVLPNDGDSIPAARQAAALWGRDNVSILETNSMAQGYFALAMDVANSDDVPYRLSLMERGAKGTSTLLVRTAVKSLCGQEPGCKTGECVAILNDETVATGSDMLSALIEGLEACPDIDRMETLVIFRGQNPPDSQETALKRRLDEAFPLLEKTFLYGGGAGYDWLVGIA